MDRDGRVVPLVWLEEDFDELTAAQRFIAVVTEYNLWGFAAQWRAAQIDLVDPDWREFTRWWYQQAAATVKEGTEYYLAGFTIVNEGADWIVTTNEVANGNYRAALGYLPFIAGGSITFIRKGKRVLKLTSEQAFHLHRGTVMPYSRARAISKGCLSELQAHHILEARHVTRWGLQKEEVLEVPAVILTRAEHQKITNELRRRLPYGHTYDAAEVWEVYQDVYQKHPDWLDHIRPWFVYFYGPPPK